jgi:hypothetical protein
MEHKLRQGIFDSIHARISALDAFRRMPRSLDVSRALPDELSPDTLQSVPQQPQE